MIKNGQKIELLAPAKNKECAFAAIDAGADAVYIGAGSFGARKKASNSLEDLKEIVDYAHKFLVKIYVTVNTLVNDNELDGVEKLIWDLYKIKVDAIIFQDFSFFEMNLPPIALHASTQCNNDSIEKIKFLKSCNVHRVVLPREFSLEEIKNVAANVEIETEVFIHGALCVSYSGQCYLSEYIGKRSANRGDCAQPCRKKYSLIDDMGKVILKPQYLLSMKDFSLSRDLKELLEAGVTSFKIEGRLKDADYVKNVVSYYRKKIDEIDSSLRPSLGRIVTDCVPDTTKTFNRGYTNFYFDGKRKNFINPETPKFLGEKIGEITSVKGRKISLNTKSMLKVADKLTFFDKRGELTGTTVTIVDKNGTEVLNSKELSVGTVVYRNFDSEFYKKLQTAEFTRKMPVGINVEQIGNKIQVEFKTTETSVEFLSEEDFEQAKNLEKAKDTLFQQFSKLGETEFYLEKFSVSNDFNLFIPVSKLNEIRRNLAVELIQKRAELYVTEQRDIVFSAPKYPVSKIDSSFNVVNKKARVFYEKTGSEFCADTKVPLMKTKHCLRDYAGICLKKANDNRNLLLVDEYGVKFKLNFDCKKCIMKIEEP